MNPRGSLRARLVAWVIRRRIKPRLGDMRDLARVRRVFDAPGAGVPKGATFTAATLGGVPGEWIEAAAPAGHRADPAAPPTTLFYIHGGGFVACSAATHRPLTASLARQGLRVFAPDYRLAPEHVFPAAVDDVVAAWRALRAQWVAEGRRGRLVVAGDSAGGNLALALMLTLRDAGEPLPDAAALFCPSTDMTGGSASLLENDARDPMFSGPALERLCEAYLGPQDRAHPLASPLQAALHGLPPILLHVGESEVLRDDTLRLVDKIRAAGGRADLGVWPGVPHAWQLVPWLPEARASVRAAARFLREAPPLSQPEHLDVLIIGAGLSGIGSAAHLQRSGPQRRYAILESRVALGGTWDLFRYPGIRSDSDMHTLGYAFRPWKEARAIADGPSIRQYLADTAQAHGIERHVRYGHRVLRADWSSATSTWTVEVERTRIAADGSATAAERVQLRCNVLLACAGYYRYDAGHRPTWEGESSYRGRIVHPQLWPDDLDTVGKRVVVIGSGATAVTLVPELAKSAAHVTMLQRSPSYVMSLPSHDPIARVLRHVLPERWAYRLVRGKNILLAIAFFQAARRWPARIGGLLVAGVRRGLGPDRAQEVAAHFTPRYAPWDQRVCFVPDGDLFTALKSGRAEMVTDTIERFTPQGVRLATGRELPADVVVTATGLQLCLMGDVALTVDGRAVDLAQAVSYKAVMFSDVPNLVSTFGYTNASWTLKADLTAAYACRLLDYLDRHRLAAATPRRDPAEPTRPFLDFSSGYVQRGIAGLPRQGVHAPWKLHQNYLKDWWMLVHGRIDDGVLQFSPRGTPSATAATASPGAAANTTA